MVVKNTYPAYASESARKLALQRAYRNVQKSIRNKDRKKSKA
jgi:hypothetical protein